MRELAKKTEVKISIVASIFDNYSRHFFAREAGRSIESLSTQFSMESSATKSTPLWYNSK